MHEARVLDDLPDDYAVGVGRVIARFACLEWHLIEALRLIIGVGPKEARYIFKSAEGTEYVPLIRALAKLRGLDAIELSKLNHEEFKRLRDKRNLLAHGVWIKDPDTGAPLIQNIIGEWQSDPGQPVVSRKISPEGLAFDHEAATEVVGGIDAAIEQVALLLKKLGAKGPPTTSNSMYVNIGELQAETSARTSFTDTTARPPRGT